VSVFKKIAGGVTAPQGFKASGIHAGIKGPKLDMALVLSDRPAAVAGTFTSNRVQGNTVKLCQEHLTGRVGQAIIVNSGNANACVGPQGMRDARRMAQLTGERLGLDDKLVFVASTGVIGRPMPMEKIEAGIHLAVEAVAPKGGPLAAKAIMTTDTVDKQVALEFKIDGKTVRLGGMAKGAGMIEPHMATMLAFFTTDAAVEPRALQKCLSAAVERSFNRISVDGDQSCNDTALLLANGRAGNRVLSEKHGEWGKFSAAVNEAALALALAIVQDGEGATKFVTIHVKGAASDADALLAARAISRSLLVKTAFCGEDPNWGRIIDAVGYSGAEVCADRADIHFDKVPAFRQGRALPEMLKALEGVMKQKRFSIHVNLRLGQGADTVYTCDCSEEYVRINSEYTT
jgi:glutamate N-acetyltransferase/amino-acid N-acetyltransferase